MLSLFGTAGSASIWVPGLLIVAGILGIIVPVIPGLLIAVLGVLIWALDLGTTTGWVVFGICLAIYAAGLAMQFLLPGRRMKAAGIGTSTLLLGALLGIIGFFVIPVIGGPLGFVLGIYLVEMGQSRDRAQAWAQTKVALRGVLHSMGIELIAGMSVLTTWIVGVLITR
ncbi:DUF456 domain-containing protein [Nostocoides australiense]|nr:DUF456 domain-containing protein [Actinomycetota bacterium]HPF80897.1 DUF456 domain-containing protein [Tetrasphaera australiensis]